MEEINEIVGVIFDDENVSDDESSVSSRSSSSDGSGDDEVVIRQLPRINRPRVVNYIIARYIFNIYNIFRHS